MSTLQQPPRWHLEARKCWLLGLRGGLQALLSLGTAQRSLLPCTEQRHEGRRKPPLMSALPQWVLHLLQLLLETIPPWQEPPSPQESVVDQHGQRGNRLMPGPWASAVPSVK